MVRKLVAGVDYGSDSVRVLLADATTGEAVADGVCAYPRWAEKRYCNPAAVQYRQHALDYIEGLEAAMKTALGRAGEGAGQDIIGIAVDTTGSTPGPVDRDGTPLCLLEEFKDNPNAMFHLWKDHTAVEEAKEINEVFSAGDIDYTKYQGIYSSEWFWAKILHTTRVDERIREAAWTWTEHCDWIAGLLVGNVNPDTIAHCSCAAGHKALWHSEFGGLPSEERLSRLDPYLCGVAERYKMSPVPAGTCIGTISKEWAGRLGVNPEAKIGAGSFDAHAGGVGAGVGLHTLVQVVGTSTVEMLVDKPEVLRGKNLKEYCGQAEDSIVPGYVGLEMSQPAFGDVYAWFKELLLWPMRQMEIPEEILDREQRQKLTDYLAGQILPSLEKEAKNCIEEDLTALDWFNGRRYPKLNESVRAAINRLSLGTRAPSIYCALVKGTVFGCKRVYNSLVDNGLQIDRIIAVGGIAKKSPFIMQMMSDALGVPIMVCKEEQMCAKGAAVYAAVAAGVFASVEEGQRTYCEAYKANYFPDDTKRGMYEQMYEDYLCLGEAVETELA